MFFQTPLAFLSSYDMLLSHLSVLTVIPILVLVRMVRLIFILDRVVLIVMSTCGEPEEG